MILHNFTSDESLFFILIPYLNFITFKNNLILEKNIRILIEFNYKLYSIYTFLNVIKKIIFYYILGFYLFLI